MTAVDTAEFAPAGRKPAPGTLAVRLWLVAVAVLVFAMVVVGGATRLTDSGLSITEWQPLLGAVPPLDSAAWDTAFAQYRATPQYRLMNHGMTLAEFQFIYWWEWAHRFLGRIVGVVFFLPFVAFVASGRITRRQMPRFLVLLALGGLQGAVGWWMVASGLVDRVDVAPYRLALHLTLACVILAGLVHVASVFGTARRSDAAAAVPRSLRNSAAVLVGLVFLQIFLGGLVAGNDAGLVYNTWPTMNGAMVPDGLFALEPRWRNLFENHATVQFMHRAGAYLLLVAVLFHLYLGMRIGITGRLRVTNYVVATMLALQVGLGIATLLSMVPLRLALLHQALAVTLLAVATFQYSSARMRCR